MCFTKTAETRSAARQTSLHETGPTLLEVLLLLRQGTIVCPHLHATALQVVEFLGQNLPRRSINSRQTESYLLRLGTSTFRRRDHLSEMQSTNIRWASNLTLWRQSWLQESYTSAESLRCCRRCAVDSSARNRNLRNPTRGHGNRWVT